MAHTMRREARQMKREGIAGIVASGNHLAGANDEPEPFSEEELIDVRMVPQQPVLNAWTDDWHARNDAHALDLQVQFQGFIGGLPA